MKGYLYIDEKQIGEVFFTIIDESMGVIGGDLIKNDNYQKYQTVIQKHYEEKGVSNMEDFNVRIFLDNNVELKPQGGIGILDSVDFDEIYVESAGNNLLNLTD